MVSLPITLVTASVLGLMLIWLSARVISSRVKNEAGIGDNGNVDLLYLIRTHGNLTEYAPLFLVILGLLEVSGAHRTVLVGLAAVFVVARISHVLGMGETANLKFRQVGVIATFLCIVVGSLYGLFIALT